MSEGSTARFDWQPFIDIGSIRLSVDVFTKHLHHNAMKWFSLVRPCYSLTLSPYQLRLLLLLLLEGKLNKHALNTTTFAQRWIILLNHKLYFYLQLFQGNIDNNTHKKNLFEPPFYARFVRVVPWEWHERITLRMELLGCDDWNTPQSPSNSAPSPQTTAEDFQRIIRSVRHSFLWIKILLAAGTYVYVNRIVWHCSQTMKYPWFEF